MADGAAAHAPAPKRARGASEPHTLPSAAELAAYDAFEASRSAIKATQARIRVSEAELRAEQEGEQARHAAKLERLEAARVDLAAEEALLDVERARRAAFKALVTSFGGGAEAAYTRGGERFLDVVPLTAACGYAAEISQCRALCGVTWRRGDLGATNDMIASSLRLQCGAIAAREAVREDFDFVDPWDGSLEMMLGSTQLIRATIQNNLPRVLQLIQLGAPIDLVDQSWRFSALLWASSLGHEHVVAALLEGKYKGADVEQACGGSTALERASHFGHVGVVRALLARSAKQVRPGKTPTAMHYAMARNSIEVVKLLLAAPGSSDVLKTKDYANRTPLKVAIDRGHAEIEALLRAAGAPEG